MQLCKLLGPLLDHNFSLTPTQLQRGIAHMGANHRLRRAVRDMRKGEKTLNVGVIGTSVSFGTGG